MILLLLLLVLVGLNALAVWRGVDSRDGRDWAPLGVPAATSRR